MEKRMNKEELLALIESLNLDKNEFWVLSSGALVIRGIYLDAGDLDIAVTQKGLEELKEKFPLHQKENGWYIVTDKVECVLESKEEGKVEEWEGILLESIERYYQYLQKSEREKDKARIPLVEAYINNRDNRKVNQ